MPITFNLCTPSHDCRLHCHLPIYNSQNTDWDSVVTYTYINLCNCYSIMYASKVSKTTVLLNVHNIFLIFHKLRHYQCFQTHHSQTSSLSQGQLVPSLKLPVHTAPSHRLVCSHEHRMLSFYNCTWQLQQLYRELVRGIGPMLLLWKWMTQQQCYHRKRL